MQILSNELITFKDDEGTYVDLKGHEGGDCFVSIGYGVTEKSAWKAAKLNLEKMMRYFEKKPLTGAEINFRQQDPEINRSAS